MDPGSSSLPALKPHFFRIILPRSLQDGTLVLPPKFVNEYGKELGEYVSLEAPEGTPHAVEVERSDGRMWLHQGWQDFVDRYSIGCYFLLVFRYEGASAFRVFIYNTGCMEIDYPISDDEDEDDDDSQKPKRAKELTSKASGSSMGFDASIRRERAVERAKAFKSPHPHFISTMRPAYLSRSYLYIPECGATMYFCGREDSGMKVNGPDGRDWFMKYYITDSSPQKQVRISFGWREFVNGYGLQEGDVCLFELIDREAMEFNVLIFSVDQEN